ncbi:N-acetyltransferase [Halobacillus salinarum]|uniref:N-acetyltransferase n=1 Tax=Halobacillus salinarum TaxID=2932257 RepID=A0ABY4EGX4_9BACI|nr:GNAT family N-acetyltransferase [Halobacillus salinarum]UOQ43399.1 N-acetyltransferase [Halobacillus salinarum]
MEDYYLKYDYFKNINLEDSFFDSLKGDYEGFEDWFQRKENKKAYFYEDEKGIQAFLYLKEENEELSDVEPVMPQKKRIKIGTLKINSHGTKLGERLVKKALDYASKKNIFELYVTVFPKHAPLIKLLEKYGFEQAGNKNGELVLIKNLQKIVGDVFKDYPLVKTEGNSLYLLSIFPKFHTLLFPDSILDNETYDVLNDVSFTNSIRKIYISYAPLSKEIKPGDVILIYRTKDKKEKAPAEYRSVATSLCVVSDIKKKSDFKSYQEFEEYCLKYSVFDEKDLPGLFKKNNMVVIDMTYNLALEKRVIRRDLIEECGIDRNRNQRWSILKLNREQLDNVIELGGINESFVIN